MYIKTEAVLNGPQQNAGDTAVSKFKSNAQRVNDQERKRDSKRVLTALSGKQKEPNRGQGEDRRPSSPRPHVTKPSRVAESLNKLMIENFNVHKSICEDVQNGKPTIFLMRHGRTALDPLHRSDGWLDFPLSDEGRIGLIKAQRYLQDVSLYCIYAAPLKRTKETAEIIKSGCIHDPNIELANELKTWNLGKLTGAPKKPNKPVVLYFIEHPSETPVGGESMNDFHNRFLTWFDDQKKETIENGQPVLVVLSGSNLRAVSHQLYGDLRVLDLDEGGLGVIQYGDGSWHGSVLFGHKDDDEDEWLT